MVRASGLAEPWTHSHEESKFDQFGWRCTNKESGFGISTLVGNYSEERFDLKQRLKSKPLPSQYNHYFDTTYDTDFNKQEPKIPEDARGLKRYHPRTFPGHQPEVDTAQAKAVYNDWNTNSMASYRDFSSLRTQPHTATQLRQAPVATEAQQWNVTMETTPISHLGARAGPPAPGGHVIAAPHGAPGSGAGAHQVNQRSTPHHAC